MNPGQKRVGEETLTVCVFQKINIILRWSKQKWLFLWLPIILWTNLNFFLPGTQTLRFQPQSCSSLSSSKLLPLSLSLSLWTLHLIIPASLVWCRAGVTLLPCPLHPVTSLPLLRKCMTSYSSVCLLTLTNRHGPPGGSRRQRLSAGILEPSHLVQIPVPPGQNDLINLWVSVSSSNRNNNSTCLIEGS